MEKLGLSGRIAKSFLLTEITPLLALVGFLLGLFAVLVTPREEEPQINVTFANVFIPFPGASAKEVEQIISSPAEQIVAELEGLEHVYSVSRPGMSILTVQFEVGQDRTQAIVRLYNAIYSNQDWLPVNLGVGRPLIKPKGIDDVPIVTLTLWIDDYTRGTYDLLKVSHAIETEIKRVNGTRDIYTIGGTKDVVHVILDSSALAAHNMSIADLRKSLNFSNAAMPVGQVVTENKAVAIQAGEFLSTAEEVKDLIVGVHAGNPVYLRDVATIKRGPEHARHYAQHGNSKGRYPAVTMAISKQPGTNAVDIANNIINRVEQLKGIFIPDGVNVTVTRNYGETADAKAKHLIKKLIFATISVVLLVLVALGFREAIIVGAAVVITLAITLFASWAWGFTLNRVSLFALIFSIGILVDDAIVVVENIHRHIGFGTKKLKDLIPISVDEVGGPTILATFAVIAALLPMAFVTGLMGPYMGPIPINASIGMLISLAVAFIFTPWLSNKMLANVKHTHKDSGGGSSYNFFSRVIGPFLRGNAGKSNRYKLLIGILFLIGLSVSLAAVKLVVLKMLPFDNKSEFQIIVDMPEGTPLEETNHVLGELSKYVATIPEVKDYQIYAGTAAPINFNGLVRQYYLRQEAHSGDIQVNLVDKSERDRKSHEIALSVRAGLQDIGRKLNANVKVVEVPPGPPVYSPLVAEIYGLDYDGQITVAKQVRAIFETTESIVDVDDTVEAGAKKLVVKVDQKKAALWNVSPQVIVSAISTALNGEDVSFMHNGNVKYSLPIRLENSLENKSTIDDVLNYRVRNDSGQLIALADLVTVKDTIIENARYHKDLLPVVFVTADSVGELDSPLYGMFDMVFQLQDKVLSYGHKITQSFFNQPANPYEYSLKWDGEWQITYETFRDMGIAYSVGILMIYLLVVGQFRSYIVPLIIMAPIPLTIIGVMPGHALLGSQYTATSMIGMIALAGIIVRNSILLVDFINQQVREGVDFEVAVIRSGAVRAKPIILTGLAAMLGAFFILDDPIFNGLAISLIFGILVSTVLTLVVIPVMYYAYMRNKLDTLLDTNDNT
ncbi:Acriflavin resistance protein [hydrothermal vent metagenome]|uniref:Acriflavin resistance protein n=1 Tax=hydrothermal vent metagenome TaxID=652676 RepID=A0A3B1A3L0_9ZZZZ